MDHKKKCPKCGIELPNFDENGQHNFCPTVSDKKIIEVCMKCKMEEVVKKWHGY